MTWVTAGSGAGRRRRRSPAGRRRGPASSYVSPCQIASLETALKSTPEPRSGFNLDPPECDERPSTPLSHGRRDGEAHPPEAAPRGTGTLYGRRVSGQHHAAHRRAGRRGRGHDLPALQRQGAPAQRGLSGHPALGDGRGQGARRRPHAQGAGTARGRIAAAVRRDGASGPGRRPDAAPAAGRAVPGPAEPGRGPRVPGRAAAGRGGREGGRAGAGGAGGALDVGVAGRCWRSSSSGWQPRSGRPDAPQVGQAIEAAWSAIAAPAPPVPGRTSSPEGSIRGGREPEFAQRAPAPAAAPRIADPTKYPTESLPHRTAPRPSAAKHAALPTRPARTQTAASPGSSTARPNAGVPSSTAKAESARTRLGAVERPRSAGFGRAAPAARAMPDRRGRRAWSRRRSTPPRPAAASAGGAAPARAPLRRFIDHDAAGGRVAGAPLSRMNASAVPVGASAGASSRTRV